jgi:predicted RNA-binding Zn-ribbon protein involved in translation (DUF1610 family)
VTDEPHDRYRGYDPWTGKELKHGMPILTSTSQGNVVEKDVTHKVVKCPECEIEARYTDDSEPVCPNCGIVCSGNKALTRKIVIDAKAAGRIDGDNKEMPA